MPLKGMSSFSMLSWQLTLTAEALGLDSNIALELILMITNIQTLGVPIRYAPIPASISAFFGLLFIPILGIVTDRWAKSKTSKANILIMTACVLLTGSLSVLTANALKLFYCNTNTQGDYDHRNHTAELHSSTINFTRSSPRAAHLIAFSNGSVGASLDYLVQKHVNSSVLFNYSEQNIYQHISAVDLGITQPSRMTVSNSSGNKIKSTPFYAYIAMVGYGLMDAGHDLGGCFLKTFVLHCTPPAYQTGVLVKLIFISSVGLSYCCYFKAICAGAVITSALASIDVGATLTANTDYDSNAALALVTSAVSSTLLLLGTITTLITGFCWKPPSNSLMDEIKYEDLEKSVLIRNSNTKVTCTDYGTTPDGVTEPVIPTDKEENPVHWVSTIDKSPRDQTQLMDVLKQHKEQIQVNIMTFGTMSAVACYGIFGANFVGSGIYKGDPAAPSGSKEYQKFLDGVTVGSQGTLMYFVVFAIASLFHQKSLDLFGWKKETVVITFSHFVLCVVLASSKNIYVFYITCIWTGMLRTVSMTVPYILVNKISAEKHFKQDLLCKAVTKGLDHKTCINDTMVLFEGGAHHKPEALLRERNDGKCSTVAISLIAAMMPCGFLACGTAIGPLIEATGSPDVTMWYAGACAGLACVFACILNI
ncbi:hypothetical protein RRG08_024964 [Elysia crispata]|uniref:Uncharacterized protein n=1 Tax=Elysia crispata TaxID=231223 RepID=A0AAE1ATP5_9GAST|nr:hypothetical protein RRG08_024964 [Elysia crispata]